MSLRLGMIVSKDCNERILELLREEYNLKFIHVQNLSFSEQISTDEMLIEPTGLYNDSKTGIGSFDLYNVDINALKEQYKDDSYAYHVVLDEYLERRDSYRKDAIKWLNIIKVMKQKYLIAKVGLFYFDGYDTTEKVNFPKFSRRHYVLNEIDEFSLMKIGEKEIAFFV
ncbi:hypothetical protein [Faecalispora jeddahensis]|uniref:hypothetical protein n=1 Tax=Faecalispora jeddahensis TaxID=1414721 RepID=UPI00189A3754|nr:hypothetical protein [Faecalispora jeddahensis]